MRTCPPRAAPWPAGRFSRCGQKCYLLEFCLSPLPQSPLELLAKSRRQPSPWLQLRLLPGRRRGVAGALGVQDRVALERSLVFGSGSADGDFRDSLILTLPRSTEVKWFPQCQSQESCSQERLLLPSSVSQLWSLAISCLLS